MASQPGYNSVSSFHHVPQSSSGCPGECYSDYEVTSVPRSTEHLQSPFSHLEKLTTPSPNHDFSPHNASNQSSPHRATSVSNHSEIISRSKSTIMSAHPTIDSCFLLAKAPRASTKPVKGETLIWIRPRWPWCYSHDESGYHCIHFHCCDGGIDRLGKVSVV
jgi:hypothetical protein